MVSPKLEVLKDFQGCDEYLYSMTQYKFMKVQI